MSINAISAASSYYSSSSIDSEYELIKQRLKALGIASTGSKATDKLLLEKTEKAQKSSGPTASSNNKKTHGSEKPSGPPTIPPEWQDLMSQAGVTPTGDIEQDYEKATESIKSKIASATSEADKSKYNSLQTQIDNFVQDFAKASPTPPKAMIGATALSDMNRAMLVKNPK